MKAQSHGSLACCKLATSDPGTPLAAALEGNHIRHGGDWRVRAKSVWALFSLPGWVRTQQSSAVSWKLMFTKLTGEARTISSRLEILGGIQLEGLCLSHPRVLRSAATDLTGWLNDVDRSAVAFYWAEFLPSRSHKHLSAKVPYMCLKNLGNHGCIFHYLSFRSESATFNAISWCDVIWFPPPSGNDQDLRWDASGGGRWNCGFTLWIRPGAGSFSTFGLQIAQCPDPTESMPLYMYVSTHTFQFIYSFPFLRQMSWCARGTSCQRETLWCNWEWKACSILAGKQLTSCCVATTRVR